MAIGTTLNDLVEMVRNESRLSSNTSRGTDMRENIVQLIRRHYQMLADSFDWQHLELKRDMAYKDIVANQRYYDFPTNLNTDKIASAWFKYGEIWTELDYGISFEDYNSQDSEQGQTSNLVYKWDWYGASQFEAFPIPATTDAKISFVGQKKINALINDDSLCDLDDILISLHVAAEILAGNGQQAAAQIKAEAANRRLSQMRAGKSDQSRVQIGLGNPSSTWRPRDIQFVR